jgi:hypothetical protein
MNSGEELLMSELVEVTVDVSLTTCTEEENITVPVEDTQQESTYIENEVEAELIANEELDKMVQEATEEDRIGTQLELNMKNPKFMQMVGLELKLFTDMEARLKYEEAVEPTLEEQLLNQQYVISPERKTELEVQRQLVQQRYEPEAEIEELETPVRMYDITDFQALSAIELALSQLYPTQFNSIMGQLFQLCEAKATFLPAMIGFEALQRHMMEIYVPYFSAFPYSLNLLAMRITAANMYIFQHKTATLYAMGAMQAQMVKCKWQINVCEYRTLETKIVASGKTFIDAIPTKISLEATEDLDEDEVIPLINDTTGHPMLWMVLRYAYKLPYRIRRLIAVMTGMPENYKYGLYFGIGGLPSRYSTWKQKWLKNTEAQYLNYSINKDTMDMIRRYQAKRGYFYARYGKYYDKRRP